MLFHNGATGAYTTHRLNRNFLEDAGCMFETPLASGAWSETNPNPNPNPITPTLTLTLTLTPTPTPTPTLTLTLTRRVERDGHPPAPVDGAQPAHGLPAAAGPLHLLAAAARGAGRGEPAREGGEGG